MPPTIRNVPPPPVYGTVAKTIIEKKSNGKERREKKRKIGKMAKSHGL